MGSGHPCDWPCNGSENFRLRLHDHEKNNGPALMPCSARDLAFRHSVRQVASAGLPGVLKLGYLSRGFLSEGSVFCGTHVL